MTQEEIKQAIEKLKNLWETSQNQEAKAYAYELLEEQAIQEDVESLAKVYNILGIVYKNLSDYPKALEYIEKALLINEEIGRNEGVAINLGNIGNVYGDLSDYPKALEYYSKALQINEEISNKKGMAINLGNIGLVYSDLSDYPKALEYYSKALHIIEEIGNKVGIAANLGNIGNVYRNLSDYPKALEYYSKAFHIYEEIGNKVGIATNLGNIGIIYDNLSDYPKAIEYYSKSLHINEEIGNKSGIAKNLGCIGIVYLSLSDYPKALEYHSKALHIDEEIGNKVGIGGNLVNIGIIYSFLSDYGKALEYYGKALVILEEIGHKHFQANALVSIGKVYFIFSDYSKALEYYSKALHINEEIGSIKGVAGNLVNIGIVYATKESTYYDAKKAEEYLQKTLLLAEEIGAINTTKEAYENLHTLRLNEELFEEALEFYKKSVEIEKEIQSEEATNTAQQFDQRRKLEEDEKARQLKLARFQEQEKILHNILPIKIADRILKQETFIADHFESVSVLFMDLVGFTSLSSIAPPKQLVYLLDTIFTKADDVLEQFGLEKIKTIGDGYLAVANVTSPLENHQKATALAALELLETMKDFTVNIPTDLGDSNWTKDMNDIEIRIGIHTGEVVAGIIGKNKYTYDLWGDAVNVASRMESNSKAGRIHISEQFAKSIESNPEFNLILHGEVTIKGKGEMNTFWLERGKL